MFAVSKQVSIGNRILASLPYQDLERLESDLTPVHLEKGEVVYITGDRIRDCYFLNSGLLSLLSSTETGSTV